MSCRSVALFCCLRHEFDIRPEDRLRGPITFLAAFLKQNCRRFDVGIRRWQHGGADGVDRELVETASQSGGKSRNDGDARAEELVEGAGRKQSSLLQANRQKFVEGPIDSVWRATSTVTRRGHIRLLKLDSNCSPCGALFGAEFRIPYVRKMPDFF